METKVYLIGAGTGDSSLITVKGAEILKKCTTLIYDRLVSLELLMYVNPLCKIIYVGKEMGNHSVKQDEINRILVEEAERGGIVVRLKGGDPFVFSRGGEEVEALIENNIPYEVISGVTSAVAVPASVGIPVTHRAMSRSFHVITGHTADNVSSTSDNFKTLAKLEGTLVFLMGVSNLLKIVENLIKKGKSPATPVAVISNGNTSAQKSVRGTLGDIVKKVSQANITAPAVIVIGDVAGLHLTTEEKKRLSGKKIGISGTRSFYSRMSELLKDEGAETVPVNIVETEEINRAKVLDAMRDIEHYSWLCFTSPNGVEAFFDTIADENIDLRIFSKIKFAVIGSSTAEMLKKRGFTADLMPTVFTGTALGEEMRKNIPTSERILILRSKRSFAAITDILDFNRNKYEELDIYNTFSNKELTEELTNNIPKLDMMVFASPYSVKSYFDIKNPYRLVRSSKLVAIGATTKEMLEKYDVGDILIPEKYTAEGILSLVLSQAENL